MNFINTFSEKIYSLNLSTGLVVCPLIIFTYKQLTNGLYNGNIAWMATQLPEAGRRNDDGEKQGYQAMLYNYDQLNRIMAANSLTGYSAFAGFGSRSAENEAYDARYSYDPNGNLLTLQRYDQQGSISHDYNYTYFAGTNRLQKVLDEYIPPVPESKTYNTNPLVPDGEKYKHITLDSGAVVPTGNTANLEATESIVLKPGTVIESGATFTATLVSPDTIVIPPEGQYLYDEIGNLVRDNAERATISWTPYGKVRSVTKDNGDVINFAYDAAGNRVEKEVITSDTTITTHYIRDASGNVMATYTNTELKEQPIYGSSRLGMYRGGTKPGQEQLGNKYYELTNHLGNVLAVITDNINIDDTHVTASVASVSDYYPFGLGMDGRTFSEEDYRYGFNGKEKDPEGLGGGGSTYDYGFRIYNPAIAKFLSVDPLTKSYPFYTPYQFSANMPIAADDLDGLEAKIRIFGKFWLSEVNRLLDEGDVNAAIRKAFIASQTTLEDLETGKDREWAMDKEKGGWGSFGSPAKMNYVESLGKGSIVILSAKNEILYERYVVKIDNKWAVIDWFDKRLKADGGKWEIGITFFSNENEGGVSNGYTARRTVSVNYDEFSTIIDAFSRMERPRSLRDLSKKDANNRLTNERNTGVSGHEVLNNIARSIASDPKNVSGDDGKDPLINWCSTCKKGYRLSDSTEVSEKELNNHKIIDTTEIVIHKAN